MSDLLKLAGRSPVAHLVTGTPRIETQEDAYGLLARGGFFYVGGKMIQPELVTGVSFDPDSGAYTFERSGSPDVVSDPDDPADIGDLLFRCLLLGHGSPLLHPWVDTRVVSVPSAAPAVPNISLQFTGAIHPRWVGVWRLRCYDAADDVVAYSHPYGAALDYTDSQGREYGKFSGEFLQSAPSSRGLILDHDADGFYPDNVAGGGTGQEASWPDTTVHRIEVEATPEIAPSSFEVLSLPGVSLGAGSVILAVAGLTADLWSKANGVLSFDLS